MLALSVLDGSVLCRITSYNVCYTKLLRTLFDNNVQFQSIEFKKMLLEHELKLKALPPFTVDPNSQMIGVVPKELYDEAFRLVITSYSIHYTKLYEII